MSDSHQNARDAWALYSWLIWPINQRDGATRANLRLLADALDAWPGGLEGPTVEWPPSLRQTAENITK